VVSSYVTDPMRQFEATISVNRQILRRAQSSCAALQEVLSGNRNGNMSALKYMTHAFLADLSQIDYLDDIASKADRVDFLKDQLAIRFHFEHPSMSGEEFNHIFGHAQSLLRIISNSLLAPIPSPESRFKFILNDDIRQILDRDLEQAERCLTQGFDKAVTVLAGSILESALYGILRRNPVWTMDSTRDWKTFSGVKASRNIDSNDYNDQWSFKKLIDFVCDNKILNSDKWREQLHQAIRQPRNLVHPTVELTKVYGITQESAAKSLAVLMDVLNDLSASPLPPK
jgi:hypothetical protein